MHTSTPQHRRSRRLTGRARVAAQAVVLALVVAGTTAFAALHKTVTLDVDGSVTTVTAFGRTVGDVLAAQRVAVHDQDLVAPGLGTRIGDGAQIVVRHGRQVVVEVDGVQREVWTTAMTVGDVVAELGLREGTRASASRSDPLGRDVVRLSTDKTVHVVDDGRSTEVQTSASTVREVLRESDVVLGEHDLVSVSLDAAAVDGLMVIITRVDTVIRTEDLAHPFSTVRTEDGTLVRGREVVSQRGREGVSTVTYESYEADGVEVGRSVLAQTVVTPARDEVIRVGTFDGPDLSTMPAVEPGTSRAIAYDMVLARGWSEQEWACLDALWSKESGWRVNAHNAGSGAYGIPQAVPGSKMASAGADWTTNPATQITWGLGYIAGRYATPCGAWAHSVAKNWY